MTAFDPPDSTVGVRITHYRPETGPTCVIGVTLGRSDNSIQDPPGIYEACGRPQHRVPPLAQNCKDPGVVWVKYKGTRKNPDREGFAFAPGLEPKQVRDAFKHRAPECNGTGLGASWDHSSFCVLGYNTEGVEALRTVYDAIKQGTFVVDMPSIPRVAGDPNSESVPVLSFARLNAAPEMWLEVNRKVSEILDTEYRMKKLWAVETTGLVADMIAMGTMVQDYIGTGPALPADELSCLSEDGRWFRGDLAPFPGADEGDIVLKARLVPSRKTLWGSNWYTSEELFQWILGQGPVWPLFVVLPDLDGPEWEFLQAHEGGCGIVPIHEIKGWPSSALPSPLWNDQHFEAANRGYPQGCVVTDEAKAREAIEAYQRTPMGHNFDPVFLGRGTPHLQRILSGAWKDQD